MTTSQKAVKIQGVENVINYQFNDPDILWEALQAAGSGVTIIGNRRLNDGNKRLAILGDVILDIAVIDDWYPGMEPRGRIDLIKQTVCSNPNLDRVARLDGLDIFVNRNPAQGQMVSPGLMSTTMEAMIGAVWLDSDLTTVKRVMRTLGLVPT